MAPDDTTPLNDKKPETDEVSAALDGKPDEAPAEPTDPPAPSDPITDSVKAEVEDKGEDEAPAEAPAEDAKPAGLDAAVATEAEGKPEAEVEPPPAPAEPSPEASTSSTAGSSGSGGTEGASGASAPAEAPAEAPAPAAEDKPAEPASPSFGDVQSDVVSLSDHLPADTLDKLREAGAALFLFLADLGEVDTSGVAQEAKARLSNVQDKTVGLLSAIESVFIRKG